jgi:hypothetical protein
VSRVIRVEVWAASQIEEAGGDLGEALLQTWDDGADVQDAADTASPSSLHKAGLGGDWRWGKEDEEGEDEEDEEAVLAKMAGGVVEGGERWVGEPPADVSDETIGGVRAAQPLSAWVQQQQQQGEGGGSKGDRGGGAKMAGGVEAEEDPGMQSQVCG